MDAGARPHRPARAAARRQRVSGVRGRIVLISLSRELGGAELHVERLAAYLVRELDDTIELICRPDQALDPWCRRLEAAGDVELLGDLSKGQRGIRREHLADLGSPPIVGVVAEDVRQSNVRRFEGSRVR